MGAELVFGRGSHMACENGKFADVAYEQYLRRGAGKRRKQVKQMFQSPEIVATLGWENYNNSKQRGKSIVWQERCMASCIWLYGFPDSSVIISCRWVC